MKCNNCGHELTDAKGKAIIGMRLCVANEEDRDHPEIIRFRQRYGVSELNICLVCLAQGIGMRRSTYMNQDDSKTRPF
jgi:hypothetical protein